MCRLVKLEFVEKVYQCRLELSLAGCVAWIVENAREVFRVCMIEAIYLGD